MLNSDDSFINYDHKSSLPSSNTAPPTAVQFLNAAPNVPFSNEQFQNALRLNFPSRSSLIELNDLANLIASEAHVLKESVMRLLIYYMNHNIM